MGRDTDLAVLRKTGAPMPLPPVDWPRVGASAPVPLDNPLPSAQRLPSADVVLMTWAGAEWLALDHVFLNSAGTVHISDQVDENSWTLFSVKAPQTSDTQGGKLWGYFRIVRVGTKQVLLVKSDAHLAHPPWYSDLYSWSTALAETVKNSQIKLVISVGTAGGSTSASSLGDVMVTPSAHLWVEKHQTNIQDSGPANNQTFTSAGTIAAGALESVEEHLLLSLKSVVTTARLQNAIQKAHNDVAEHSPGVDNSFTYQDVVGKTLDPTRLVAPKVTVTDKPVLSTDWYYIAPAAGAAQWSSLEMDDAVVAKAALDAKARFISVRNISDPFVAGKRQNGAIIPDEARQAFASRIYDEFGAYTSFNSALVAWGLIASL